MTAQTRGAGVAGGTASGVATLRPLRERSAMQDLCQFVLIAEGLTEVCRAEGCALWRDGCVVPRAGGSAVTDERVAALVVGLRNVLGAIDESQTEDDLDGGIARRWAETLTPAERRVFRLLPTHWSLGAIADHLSLSRATVKSHVRSIYKKLHVTSRDEAVQRGVDLRMIGTVQPVVLARRRAV